MAMKDKSNTRNQETQDTEGLAGKYLTFGLGQEGYGISILKIKEIIGMIPITPLPHTPAYIKGVINLRGKVIPVTDLRLKFGLLAQDYSDRTCIIVVEIHNHSKSIIMGLLVDGVSEVANIRGGDIEKTPDFGTRLQSDFIQGIAKMDGRVKILLDIDRLLTEEQLSSLADPPASRKEPHAAVFPLEEAAA